MVKSGLLGISTPSTLGQVEQDIRQAERMIYEKVQCTIAALRKGEDTAELERRIRDRRRVLELLYVQRREIVRAAHRQDKQERNACDKLAASGLRGDVAPVGNPTRRTDLVDNETPVRTAS